MNFNVEISSALPRVPWRRAPLLLLAYAAAIVLLTWPWLAAPGTRVFDHWDPPFHAWKLAFAARTLLGGHVLPPYGNTNLYYPNSGAFFYEALHWPQAVFAAPLLACGLPEVLVYHVTLVFFWALSGVVFWAWLRALGLRGGWAAAGGLFFTVIPYRMSYAVEFNMQLSFGLPLLLFALARFYQRPAVRYAALGAVAWWLQATSELYQAVFALFALPFWLPPLLARDPSLLRSWRRFWLPLLAAAALCAALSLPFLLPYAKTLGDGTLLRSLDEMRLHSLEPFAWLLPAGRFRFLPQPAAHTEEMSVYPTVALAAVALFGLLSHSLAAARRRPAARLFAALSFLAVLSLLLFHFARGAAVFFAHAASWLLLAAAGAALPWLCRRNRSPERAVLSGLGSAAFFGFVMGFGPFIRDAAADASVPNRLFLLLHAASPALSGFRVVSRFSVFPVLALCTAAAFGFRDAARALPVRPRFLRPAAAVLFFALFLAECLPAPPLRTRPVRDVSSSAAIAAFDALPGPAVLAVVPMGERRLDSEHMLAVERHDRLGVWAWGGTYPRWTLELKDFLDPYRGDAAEAVSRLRQLWPEAFVLEDRRPFRGLVPADFAAFFGPLAETVAEDPDFRLFRILPSTAPAPEAVRLVRIDFASDRPRAVFTLSAPSPARVWLDFNGVPLGAFDAGPEPASFDAAIPAGLLVHHLPQRYRFHAEGDAPFLLSGFRLEPLPEGAPRPEPPASRPDLPWLGTFSVLPPSATPLAVRYPGGIELCGTELRPGGLLPPTPSLTLWTIPLRFYFRFRGSGETPPAIRLAPGYTLGDDILYKCPVPLRAAVDANAFPFSAGRLVAADVALPVLGHFPEGAVYGLLLDLQTAAGRRISGRAPDGSKVRYADLPFRHTVHHP